MPVFFYRRSVPISRSLLPSRSFPWTSTVQKKTYTLPILMVRTQFMICTSPLRFISLSGAVSMVESFRLVESADPQQAAPLMTRDIAIQEISHQAPSSLLLTDYERISSWIQDGVLNQGGQPPLPPLFTFISAGSPRGNQAPPHPFTCARRLPSPPCWPSVLSTFQPFDYEI